MRHKYILLLFYLLIFLCGVRDTTAHLSEEKKANDDSEQSNREPGSTSSSVDRPSDSATEKDNDVSDQNLLNDFEKFKAQVVKIVDAPDLSKTDAYSKKVSEDNEKAEEALKLFFKKQNKLLRKIVAQVEGYDVVDDGEGDLELDELDNVENGDSFENAEEEVQEVVVAEPAKELSPEEREGELYCQYLLKFD